MQPNEREVIGYVRVSTDEQRELGLSIAAQEAQIHEHARILGLPAPRILREAESAKSIENRPVFSSVLGAIQRGEVRALMVWRLDRAFRNTRDALAAAAEMTSAGCQLVEMTEIVDTVTPDGEFLFTLKAALSQRERKLIGLRTRMALAHAKTLGIKLGRAPFGLIRIKQNQFGLAPETGETLAKMFAARRAGRAYRDIAEDLNAAGIAGPNGGRWSTTTVYGVLTNKEVLEVLANTSGAPANQTPITTPSGTLNRETETPL